MEFVIELASDGMISMYTKLHGDGYRRSSNIVVPPQQSDRLQFWCY
jgi:hypothetical protein